MDHSFPAANVTIIYGNPNFKRAAPLENLNSPHGYWKSHTAVEKLAGAANTAKKWLSRQALWKIFLPTPRRIPNPKLDVPVPNAVHQADLLFMPYDRLGRTLFKYALTVVEIACRFKEVDQVIVERFNRTLSEQLFSHQYAVEMRLPAGQ